MRSVAVVLCAIGALTSHPFEGSGQEAQMGDAHTQDVASIKKWLSQDVAATLARDMARSPR